MKTKFLNTCAVLVAIGTSGVLQAAPSGHGARPGGPPPAAKPKPPSGASLIERIEAKLGRVLTEAERKEIGDAIKTFEQALRDANDDAAEAIASALNISMEKAKRALQSPNPLEALSKAVGAKLTKSQADAVRAALRARFEAKKAAERELFETLLSLTGLTPEELHEVLKPKGGDCDKDGQGGGKGGGERQ